MTAEEAIEIIQDYQVNGCGFCHTGGEEVVDAFRMAVDALEESIEKSKSSTSILMTKEEFLDYCDSTNPYYDYRDNISYRLDKLIEATTRKMNDKWEELRSTIQELYDNNAEKSDVVTVTQFLLNLMDVLDGKKTE